MARGNLPAQTPVVNRDSFVAFDLLYRYVNEMDRDVRFATGGPILAFRGKASDTTLAIDSAFSAQLLPSQRVRVRIELATTGNVKLRHVGPAGASLIMLERKIVDSSGSSSILDSAYSAADITLATPSLVTIQGIIHNGATAGPFGISWAQATSSVTPAGLQTGSSFSYSLIA